MFVRWCEVCFAEVQSLTRKFPSFRHTSSGEKYLLHFFSLNFSKLFVSAGFTYYPRCLSHKSGSRPRNIHHRLRQTTAYKVEHGSGTQPTQVSLAESNLELRCRSWSDAPTSSSVAVVSVRQSGPNRIDCSQVPVHCLSHSRLFHHTFSASTGLFSPPHNGMSGRCDQDTRGKVVGGNEGLAGGWRGKGDVSKVEHPWPVKLSSNSYPVSCSTLLLKCQKKIYTQSENVCQCSKTMRVVPRRVSVCIANVIV